MLSRRDATNFKNIALQLTERYFLFIYVSYVAKSKTARGKCVMLRKR